MGRCGNQLAIGQFHSVRRQLNGCPFAFPHLQELLVLHKNEGVKDIHTQVAR